MTIIVTVFLSQRSSPAAFSNLSIDEQTGLVSRYSLLLHAATKVRIVYHTLFYHNCMRLFRIRIIDL